MIAAAPPPVYPWPIGLGARYHPGPANPQVARGSAFGRFRCGNARTFAVHLELFAKRQVVIVPPRLGIADGTLAGKLVALLSVLPTALAVSLSRDHRATRPFAADVPGCEAKIDQGEAVLHAL